ncbi:MAG: DUF3883 domain-containing protein [Euryarchaeota archaeon]|nr:DUF3883 domain-containing protein [Euryarchaeota archaeon]MDE1837456.1 DUF3883 domain-containing protein [Euryarchaeota archaeon]MDE1881871.1 DUF3883 domain-containing protein [Euryarchaeota archaeon]MDE2045578.1 DUF3883 domain-containing protein [Thermoplasmata archaeon]
MGWSTEEVRAVVSAYFEMLGLEATGSPYVKADFNRKVREVCKNRTRASVELKFQNVSAILAENDLARIEGYKPKGHYQGLLAQQVLAHVASAPPLHVERPSDLPLPRPPVRDWKAIIVPRPIPLPRPPLRTPLPPRHAVRIDYAARDAVNRRLGRAGEEFVLDLEQRRLNAAGLSDLARRIVHVSKEVGDGLGYDLRSFNDDGEPSLVEVKTTRLGPHAPFFLSAGELDFARSCEEEYRIARVFRFGSAPGLFFLKRIDLSSLRMEAQQYRCWV